MFLTAACHYYLTLHYKNMIIRFSDICTLLQTDIFLDVVKTA